MTKPTPLPAAIRIGHLSYAVSIDQPGIDAASLDLGHRLAGASNMTKQVILLSEDQGPDYRRDTMLHEVLHQCLRVSGQDPDADAAAQLKDVEERTIVAMSGPLLAALRDNPELVAYLTAD